MFTFKNYSKFVYPVYEAINMSSQVATGQGAFDKAIKSLYTISPTNISQDPDKRKKNDLNFKTS